MIATLIQIAWRLALCGAISYAAFRLGGLVTMVPTLTLSGVMLAKPLIDLLSDLRHEIRRFVWRAEMGHYYVYRGTSVQVIEDDDPLRWVRAADVRRIVGFTASDGALSLTYPQGWRVMGAPPEPHFSHDALLAHLRTERSAEAVRFANWVERTIAYPARTRATRAVVE